MIKRGMVFAALILSALALTVVDFSTDHFKNMPWPGDTIYTDAGVGITRDGGGGLIIPDGGFRRTDAGSDCTDKVCARDR